jgi:hypothetical protein
MVVTWTSAYSGQPETIRGECNMFYGGQLKGLVIRSRYYVQIGYIHLYNHIHIG